MLICIGGLPGSGRRICARGLAQRLGFYYYDIDEKKLRFPIFTKNGFQEQVQYLNSDEQRTSLYRRILQDFPRLSKMYPDIVMSAGFRGIGPREYFLKEAQKYFGRTFFIAVETDDASAEERLHYGERPYTESVRKRRLMQSEFQELDTSVPVFSYQGSTDSIQESFCDFVKAMISRTHV